MIEDCIIIGGGVAGLSAANRLADKGVSALIIEAGKFPAHKICGEFFSHECLPILHQWEIPLTATISTSRFICGNNKSEFQLPISSESCSRHTFDASLLDRALKNGARVLTETSVVSLTSSDCYEVALSNGQTIKARHLMIGTGKIPKFSQTQSQHPPEMKYFGFKAHFENIDIDNSVEIHAFPGGYLGISNVYPKTTNIACLVKKEFVQKFERPENFITNLMHNKSMRLLNEKISKAHMVFPQWLIGQLPEFGIRSNPDLENVYWIGDAAGSIPPVCGDGLAIAITSGSMAADFMLQSNAAEFKKAWLKRYRTRFFLAKYIHKIMITKCINTAAVKACNMFPKLPIYLWSHTRDEQR